MEMAQISPRNGAKTFEQLDKTRVGVLIGTGIGGMSVFANNVETQASVRTASKLCLLLTKFRTVFARLWRLFRPRLHDLDVHCRPFVRSKQWLSPALMWDSVSLACVASLQVTKGFKRISPFFIPYAITNMGSGLLAMEHGFMGPNYSVSTGEGSKRRRER